MEENFEGGKKGNDESAHPSVPEKSSGSEKKDESSREVHVNENEDVNISHENAGSGSGKDVDFFEFISKLGLKRNPFVFSIDPGLMVGYENERKELLDYILQGHRVILVSGPTGSGKTTLINWAMLKLNEKGVRTVFIPKPPRDDSELVSFFRHAFRKPWFLFFLSPRFHTMNDVISYMNGKRYVVFLDEAHESSPEILEWFRVMTDQLPNTTLVISGLPKLEEFLREKLETFHQRVSMKIQLKSLTFKETAELIRKRMESAGAESLGPFRDLLKDIYAYTGGIPREVIRLCDRILNKAWKTGKFSVEENRKAPVMERSYFRLSLTGRQREIVNLLMKSDMSPPEIVSRLDLSGYKSRQHAVRAVNNILQQLMAMGYVDRIRSGKSYIYSLTPKIRNMLVRK